MVAWKVDTAGLLVDAAAHVVHRLVGELHCVERLCVGGEALTLQRYNSVGYFCLNELLENFFLCNSVLPCCRQIRESCATSRASRTAAVGSSTWV